MDRRRQPVATRSTSTHPRLRITRTRTHLPRMDLYPRTPDRNPPPAKSNPDMAPDNTKTKPLNTSHPQIDDALLSRLEELARVRIPPEERPRMLRDLSEMLRLIQKLEELPLKDIPPLRHLHDTPQTLRTPSQQEPPLPRETVLALAPDHDGKYLRVPRFVERTPDNHYHNPTAHTSHPKSHDDETIVTETRRRQTSKPR